MKINFVLPGVGISGGTRVVFEYATRLSERGHDVTVLHPVVPPQMDEGLLSPRTRLSQAVTAIHRLLTNDGVSWFDVEASVRRIPTLSPRFVKRFESSIPDADVTIATSWETAYTVAALGESKGEKAYFVQHYEIWGLWNSEECWKRVATISDDATEYPIQMSRVEPPSSPLASTKRLVDNSYRLGLDLVTISSWLERLLQEQFDQEVAATIRNSVNHETFYYDPPPETTDRTMVFVPYRRTAWKGAEQAEDLLHALSNGSFTVDLHAFAPASDPSDLPDSVTWHESVSDAELRRLYSAADVIAIPSWVEGFGLPPLEAMACKTAVVATNVGCIPDVAPDGERAVPVPPRNSEALISAVTDLIEHPSKQDHYKKAGHEFATSYSWDDCTKEFEETLREIASSNRF